MSRFFNRVLTSGLIGYCLAVCLTRSALAAEVPSTGASLLDDPAAAALWAEIATHFQPPAELADDVGDYRTLLEFADGTPIRSQTDWLRRREQLRAEWHALMGPWPEVITKPEFEYLNEVHLERPAPAGPEQSTSQQQPTSQEPADGAAEHGVTQHQLRIELAPGLMTDDAYLLVPDGPGPFPAVVVVFYEARTAIGDGKPDRDFARQLAWRGFVVLSMGDLPERYYPDKAASTLQPLSCHAYMAANGYEILASLGKVDPQRIGVMGHSYGGKWAMFASCLYDKFACAAWSDGGIVFDEKRSNVNYWDRWYLGFEPGSVVDRERGIPNEQNPRTGSYKQMIAEGRDLHELHALMAPRPFLVSGGSEDPPERWRPLNRVREVYRLLGYENRVAMTNRPKHSPSPQSNAQIVAFFEYFLKHGAALQQPVRLAPGDAP